MSRVAKSEYPTVWACDVVLSDGGAAHLRPVRPDDSDRIAAFHSSLSRETLYLRFFHVMSELPPSLLERFSHVDYSTRMTMLVELGEEIVAMASYDRIDDSETAEVAFVVSDDHQGRGLGMLLLEHLAASAQHNGMHRFIADTLDHNRSMLSVFRAAGFAVKRSSDHEVVHISFPIGLTERVRARMAHREHRSEARSVERLLEPRSIAVVGAGRRPGGLGHEILRNLREGGFTGDVYPVNRSAPEVLGERAYQSLLDLPAEELDLAVIAVPAESVPEALSQCARKNAHAAIIVSAGFAETGADGAAEERELVTWARRHGIRVVGPNCMGVVNTSEATRMNATFAPFAPRPGNVGFLSQSGAVGITLLEAARERSLGLSSFVCIGNKGDISGNDLLQYWEADDDTEVILVCLESFGNPRKFGRIASRVARRKPIVALKSGRSESGARAAACHTGARTAPDSAVEALLRQSGVIRVDSLEALLDTGQLLSHQPLPRGRRVAIVGNSGGPGILAADACERSGLIVPEIGVRLRRSLETLLPNAASVRNPVDLGAEASPDHYAEAIEKLARSKEVDALLVIHTPPIAGAGVGVAEAIADAAEGARGKPVLACLMATPGVPEALRRPGRSAIPCFHFPENAARALERAASYAEWCARPEPKRGKLPGLRGARARKLLAGWLDESPEGASLPPTRVCELLACYGIEIAAEPETPEIGSAVSTRICIQRNPDFGSLIGFGLATDAPEEQVQRLLPLTESDVRDLVWAVRSAPRLFGRFEAPSADIDTLSDLLLRAGRMVEEHAVIAEVRFDDVLVKKRGVELHAACVRIAPAALRPEHLTRRLR